MKETRFNHRRRFGLIASRRHRARRARALRSSLPKEQTGVNLRSAVRPAVDVSSNKFERLSRFCELVVLLNLAYLLYGLIVWFVDYPPRWYLMLLSLVMLVAAVAAAVKFSTLVIRLNRAAKFGISNRCISTLKAVNVPADVCEYLERFPKSKRFRGKEEFLRSLEATLGHERASEFQGIILKYARLRSDADLKLP